MLIVSGVLLLLLLVFPPAVESRPLARAIVAYRNDASPQSRSELEHQQKIVRQKQSAQSIAIVAVITANTAGLLYVSRRINSRQRVVAQHGACT